MKTKGKLEEVFTAGDWCWSVTLYRDKKGRYFKDETKGDPHIGCGPSVVRKQPVDECEAADLIADYGPPVKGSQLTLF